MNETVTVTWDVAEADRQSVLNALRTAKDTYLSHAAGMRDLADRLRDGETVPMWADGENGARAADGLAQQFDRQVDDMDRISAAIEDAPRIVFVESDED